MAVKPISALLGIDLGTTSVKVVAIAPNGSFLASAAEGYPLHAPRPDVAELDADTVLAAAEGSVRGVVAALDARGTRVRAIGFSAAMHGVVPVGTGGDAQGPVIPWLDRRSAQIAERWEADGTAAALYERTGAPVHPMLPSCKLRWLCENDPDAVRRAAKFVSLKELLLFRWTGRFLADWGMASGTGLFDVRTREWYGPAVRAAGIAENKLGTLAAPSTQLAPLADVARALDLDADAKLVIASSDGALANLGSGAVDARECALTLGSSGALRFVLEEPVFDARARTFCYAFDDRRYVVGGATSSAGATLAKIEEWLMPDVPVQRRPVRALELAAGSPPGARGVVFAPFLSGERAPFWRADLHGTLAGLDLAHERSDVLRAAFEGSAFALRSVYDALRERLPAPERLRLSGGLTRAPFVCQLIADVFARDTVILERADASAFGAAIMAGAACGMLEEPSGGAFAPVAAIRHPDPQATAAYEDAYERYRAVVAATLRLRS